MNKFEFYIIYNGIKYEQPNCRFKVDENGGITTLIRENDRWVNVKGKLHIKNPLRE